MKFNYLLLAAMVIYGNSAAAADFKLEAVGDEPLYQT